MRGLGLSQAGQAEVQLVVEKDVREKVQELKEKEVDASLRRIVFQNEAEFIVEGNWDEWAETIEVDR